MNKQQKRKRDKRRELFASVIEAARDAWIDDELTRDPFRKASDLVHPFSDLRKGDKVFRLARVSDDDQEPHLKDQLRLLRRHARAVGAIVAGKLEHIGSGTDSRWLRKAAALAKRKGARYLLAETVDRCKRSVAFGSWDRAAQPTGEELAALHSDLCGMPLITLIDPDAPLSECESYQKNRTGKCGRPRKRAKQYERRWNRCLSDVVRARRLNRKKVPKREIPRRLDRSYSTVCGWLKKPIGSGFL